jgi:pyruvate, orthophosphate dikinase
MDLHRRYYRYCSEGQEKLTDPKFDDHYHKFMTWVDHFRSTSVRANADTPDDAAKALEFGAEGIGLARTEHMFFGDKRINAVRRMIISETSDERRKALNTLLPFQRDDFLAIFRLMGDRPVTVRLLDPPLHEFLPHEDDEIIHVAHELNIPAKVLKHKIQNLKEFNPMLGHRGCRLGIVYPEITEMQTRAILEAAVTLKKEGLSIVPEIMIPLIGTVEEFIDQRAVIDRVAGQIFTEMGDKVDYLVGTMIEVPRAALTAGKIAAEAEFFSFGTNDLTQTTFAYSRDDAGKFLTHYVSEKILADDPFQVLDTEGVGRLVEIATREGRAVKPNLKVGICGEHGGEPHSIEFFYKTGLDYVSCSPFRLPLARLALAQVHLKNPRKRQLYSLER